MFKLVKWQIIENYLLIISGSLPMLNRLFKQAKDAVTNTVASTPSNTVYSNPEMQSAQRTGIFATSAIQRILTEPSEPLVRSPLETV